MIFGFRHAAHLFGYAINTDPKHLPTAVLTRQLGLPAPARRDANTDYFDFKSSVRDPKRWTADALAGRSHSASTAGDLRARRARGDRPAIS